MKRLEKIYEGKAKILYATDDPRLLIQYFKDDATAFDGTKRGTIVEKGIINNKISSTLFSLLEKEGVRTHYVETLSDREMVIKKLEIIPVEVVLRNVVAGSLAKRFGLEEGRELDSPVMEFYLKNDELHDPMINEHHIRAFKLAGQEELEQIKTKGMRVNEFLSKYFLDRGLRLVDFKLEFGRHNGEILLGDEITPDGCRLWDAESGEKMDKDRFRRDLGKVEEAYQEVCKRICG